MVTLSMDGAHQLGSLIGYMSNGFSFAVGAAIADKMIVRDYHSICLIFVDFLRSQPILWGRIYLQSGTKQRVIAGIYLLVQWMFEISLYTLSFKDGHTFLIYWGLEAYLRNYLEVLNAYLAADVPPGQEVIQHTQWWYVTMWYWLTAGTIIYWHIFRKILYTVSVYGSIPAILFGSTIWLLIHTEKAQGVSRTKEWVWYMFGKALLVWSKSFAWILNTYELSLAYTSVQIPRTISGMIANVQKERHARNHLPYYQYSTLNEDYGEIRLLEIEPGTFLSGIIKANIRYTYISNPIPYEALSYRWGDSTFSEEILINGRRFAITKSAYDLLWAQRSRYKARLVSFM
ncbi:hypothetical protein DM02DRAFT_101539 [Periconia macrospinosa]|uniref:Uncharacterized protein n=1 Tax=Periconia macrospinosa TaxID=97972 RepID=A0A2V1DFI9_9PLEO|nr:hypothetical protein DM02DRAFT_101539 [Periconia macrospinosa]